jgi:hypothetical protein
MKTAPMSKFQSVVPDAITLADELLLLLPGAPVTRMLAANAAMAAANCILQRRPVELRHLNEDLVLAFDGEKMTFCVPELEVTVAKMVEMLDMLTVEMLRAAIARLRREQAMAEARAREEQEAAPETAAQPNESPEQAG